MGVDPNKLPKREDWVEAVLLDHERAEEEKERSYLAWVYEDKLVGHSSINQIKVGEEAFIHLHLWASDLRNAGLGTRFFDKSAKEFIRWFNLRRLYCEPYAENPAPNHIVTKLGFHFVKSHRCIPGPINFEQDVNLYLLDINVQETVEHPSERG
jgi:RimJ/RimL family protein N-acetyltransferase